MAMSKASSPVTACHARRLRRRRPCANMISSRPMITSAVWLTLVSVPGTIARTSCSRCGQPGRNTWTMSVIPISSVSSAAMPGTHLRCCRRSAKEGVPLECSASSFWLMSAVFLSGPGLSRRVGALVSGTYGTPKPRSPSPGRNQQSTDLPSRRSRMPFSSVVTVNKAHRLGTGDVITESAAYGRSHGTRSRLPHSAHGHAQMLGLDDHDHAPRLQRVDERVRDLAGHPLLHLRSACVHVHQPGELGQPGDLPLLVRHVADVRDAVERHQVVLARAVDLD